MNNDKYTEQQLKDFIPRLENGRLNVKEFYEINLFVTYGVDVVPYMIIQDKIDLLENEQKWILEKIERLKKEGENPLSLFAHLDRIKIML
jgi:hypothetical protein